MIAINPPEPLTVDAQFLSESSADCRRATRWGAAQRAQGITRRHVRSGQSVELGLPDLPGAHAGRPPAGNGATARCDVARGANRAARTREVLRVSGRRAKGTFQ